MAPAQRDATPGGNNTSTGTSSGRSSRGRCTLPSSLVVLHIGVSDERSQRWWSLVAAAAGVGGGGQLEEVVVRYDTRESVKWPALLPASALQNMASPDTSAAKQLRSLRFDLGDGLVQHIRASLELHEGMDVPLNPLPDLRQLQQLTCLRVNSAIQGAMTIEEPQHWEHVALLSRLVTLRDLSWPHPQRTPIPATWCLPNLQRADLLVGRCSMKDVLSFTRSCPRLHSLNLTILHLAREEPEAEGGTAAAAALGDGPPSDPEQPQQQQAHGPGQQEQQQQGQQQPLDQPPGPAATAGAGSSGQLHGRDQVSIVRGCHASTLLRIVQQ